MLAMRDLFSKALLGLAILVGASYTIHVVNELMALREGETVAVTAGNIAWKGAGVWLLAVYAALQAKGWRGWTLVLILGLGALGDVLVERDLRTGALAFAIGHMAAIILYLSMRRDSLSGSQKWLAIVVVPAVLAITWALTKDGAILVYAALLAMMASSAWISSFPRYLVGLGAMLFVASDLLIFARLGPLADADWPGFLIWVLYFTGQVMITKGVTDTFTEMDDQPTRSR
jgi:uncharacterized membrane protein YhhN